MDHNGVFVLVCIARLAWRVHITGAGVRFSAWFGREDGRGLTINGGWWPRWHLECARHRGRVIGEAGTRYWPMPPMET